METKKMLINEDRALFEAILLDLNQFKPYLRQLCFSYENLGLGAFSYDKLKELLQNGARQSVAEYNDALESDLVASGVKNAVLKQVVLSGTGQVVTELKAALANLQNFEPKNYSRREIKLTSDLISYVDDEFVVTEEDQDKILEEHCRIYLNPGKEQEFFAVLKQAREAYLAYMEHDTKYNLGGRLLFSFSVFDKFFKTKNGTIEINPIAVSSAFKYAKIQEKYS